MEKLINIARFLRNVFYKHPEEEREFNDKRFNLSKKIDLRLTEGEYQVVLRMCQLHNITISEYFRNLNMTYVDKFIIESEAENRYNGPLKIKKVS